MIHINFQNVFHVEKGLTQEVFHKFGERIPLYLESFQSRNQGFYKTIDDDKILDDIESFCERVEGDYDHIVVLGIGGSALGTKAIRDAFHPADRKPHLHILDNVDPFYITEKEKLWDLERTLFLVISKSGGTTETLSQYYYFHDAIVRARLTPAEHFVFITGDGSFLESIGKPQGIPQFPVPQTVGGRFSVLTAVGLLPACLMGVDIRSLIDGARQMRDLFLSFDFDKNIPFQLAAVQYFYDQKNYSKNVLMPYSNQLRTLSEWFVQLLAESTGKIDHEGHPVGITPLPAVGATDQHSQLQLFVQGPKDKLVLFLTVDSFENNPVIPVDKNHEQYAFLKGVTFAQLLNTEQKGTADSLTEAGCPNLQIKVPEVNESILGSLFFLFSGVTAFLGEFMNINAFDQPGVERSKILTKEYLREQ